MITKTKAYTSSDGAVHATLEAAQRAELETLFANIARELSSTTKELWDIPEICDAIVDRQDAIKDILTMCSTSHPRARKINKAKPPAKPPRATSKAQDIMEAAVNEAVRRRTVQATKEQTNVAIKQMHEVVDAAIPAALEA